MCVRNNIIVILHILTLLFLFLSFAKSSRDDSNIVVVTECVRKTNYFKRDSYATFVFALLVMPTTIVHDIKIYYYDVNSILFYLSFRMRADVTYAYLHTAVAAIDTHTGHTTCVNIITLCSDHETLLSATAVPRGVNTTRRLQCI